MTEWATYEPAGRSCTGRALTGVVGFMAWATLDFGRGARDLGIYNCRTVRGGTNMSTHGEGRAADVGFPQPSDPRGYELLQVIRAHAVALGVQLVIWDRVDYSRRSPNGAAHRGPNPHVTHLHIEFRWTAARTLTRSSVAAITGISSGIPPRPRPQPLPEVEGPAPYRPPGEEDEDMSYLRDEQSGAIYAVYGQRYRHLSGPHWEAQEALARFAGKPIVLTNLHPWRIAAFVINLGLIRD